MTHKEQILAHLNEGRGLTRLMALTQFGCFELSARITEMNLSGHDITGHMVTTQKGQRVKLYYLEKFRANYENVKSVI